MPHSRHHFSPPPAGLFCSEIWPTIIRDYLPKRVSSGDRWITRDFPAILENRGRSTAVCMWAYHELYPMLEMPHFRNHFSPTPSGLIWPEIWTIRIRDYLQRADNFRRQMGYP